MDIEQDTDSKHRCIQKHTDANTDTDTDTDTDTQTYTHIETQTMGDKDT